MIFTMRNIYIEETFFREKKRIKLELVLAPIRQKGENPGLKESLAGGAIDINLPIPKTNRQQHTLDKTDNFYFYSFVKKNTKKKHTKTGLHSLY